MPSGEADPNIGKQITGSILGGDSMIDPVTGAALINAGSQVLGKVLAPASGGGGGPSRADASSGVSVNAPDFGGFNVNFGAGNLSASELSKWTIPIIAGVLVIAILAWTKLQRK